MVLVLFIVREACDFLEWSVIEPYYNVDRNTLGLRIAALEPANRVTGWMSKEVIMADVLRKGKCNVRS